MKVNGDGVVRSKSGSKEKTCNPGQKLHFWKKVLKF